MAASTSTSNAKTCRLLKDFSVSKLLGAGAFGAVIQVRNKLDGKEYAVKVAAMDAFAGVDMSKEVKNLAAVPQHKNLVLYSTSWEDRLTTSDLDSIKSICKRAGASSSNMAHFRVPSGSTYLKSLCIQMELCGKDLRHYLGQNSIVKDKECVEIFLQMQSGLRHIHKHNLIHRDLKPDNIFFDKNNSTSVKIGDLGLAVAHTTMRSALHSNGTGTMCYFAPEQMTSSAATHTRYDKMVDIFASGLILLELFYPKIQPSRNNNSSHVLERTFHNLKHGRQVPSSVSNTWPLISKLILKMTESDKKDRPSADEIFDTFKKPSSSTTSSSSWQRAPSSSQLQRSRPAVVHKDITCDHCGTKPIVGVRYKCSVCVNFDLCQICEHTPGVHDDKHGMIKMKTPTTATATAVPASPWMQPTYKPISQPGFQPMPHLAYRPPLQSHSARNYQGAAPSINFFPPPSSNSSTLWSMGSMSQALDSYSYPQSSHGSMMSSGYGQSFDDIPYCDRCDREITGTIYECRSCDDFLYCGHCYRSNGSAYDHRQDHDFWRIP